MNKTTFSHYGTIIAVILVLAIMVAFATPFGDYITGSSGQMVDTFSGESNSSLAESSGKHYRLRSLMASRITAAVDQSGDPLDYDVSEIGGGSLSDSLLAFTGGSIPSANVKNAQYLDVVIDGTYSSATLSFDVVDFANEGDSVAVYHYNEALASWEHIGTYLVDANGSVSATFASLCPVALVNLTKEYPVAYSQGLAFTSNGNGTCSVSGIGVCTDTDIVIPPTSPDGDSVKSIAFKAFYDNWSITSVVIPYGVTIIVNQAFRECGSLKHVEIPSSVTLIADMAFERCVSLEEISIPSNATLGGQVFRYCSGLKHIELPEGQTAIYSYDFRECYNLESIVIPSSVTSIGSLAFQNCYKLESIEIPSGVTTIRNDTFNGCRGLTSVTIPSTVTTIEGGAFEGCEQLASVEIPSSVTNIGNYAFRNCSALASITFAGESHLSSIGKEAFVQSGLTSISIPSGVTTIKKKTFSNCSSLTQVTIPENVTSIEEQAFFGCLNLTEIHFLATTPPDITWPFEAVASTCRILVPSSALESYQTASNVWEYYASKLVGE